MIDLERTELASPVGTLTVAAVGGRVVALCFDGLWASREKALATRLGTFRTAASRDPGGAASALADYFAGDLAAASRVEVELLGTAFQCRAWEALRRIPAGSTRTYAQQAAAIGAPSAVRAVGAANGANPVGILVPCHRVVGHDGSLTGFAGGLEAKRWLLGHEGAAVGHRGQGTPGLAGRRSASASA